MFVPSFVVQYLVMKMYLFHGAVGWSAVCDSGTKAKDAHKKNEASKATSFTLSAR